MLKNILVLELASPAVQAWAVTLYTQKSPADQHVSRVGAS
jgi:hypothetical protein